MPHSVYIEVAARRASQFTCFVNMPVPTLFLDSDKYDAKLELIFVISRRIHKPETLAEVNMKVHCTMAGTLSEFHRKGQKEGLYLASVVKMRNGVKIVIEEFDHRQKLLENETELIKEGAQRYQRICIFFNKEQLRHFACMWCTKCKTSKKLYARVMSEFMNLKCKCDYASFENYV